jgi:hypothetical protein
VPVFFVLGDVYNPNAAPEILICLNKVGKHIGLYNINRFVEIMISKANIHFPRMLDLGMHVTIQTIVKIIGLPYVLHSLDAP